MVAEIGSHYTLLDELDVRQDELLEQLDLLNQRIESLLTQFAPASSIPIAPPVAGEL
jgi:hypothetical protein